MLRVNDDNNNLQTRLICTFNLSFLIVVFETQYYDILIFVVDCIDEVGETPIFCRQPRDGGVHFI